MFLSQTKFLHMTVIVRVVVENTDTDYNESVCEVCVHVCLCMCVLGGWGGGGQSLQLSPATLSASGSSALFSTFFN